MTQNLVGKSNGDKFKAMWNVHSNALHCHSTEGDCRPILTREMCQLLDNVQKEQSWIKALQESGCSSNEDGLISIHLAMPARVLDRIQDFSLLQTLFANPLKKKKKKEIPI